MTGVSGNSVPTEGGQQRASDRYQLAVQAGQTVVWDWDLESGEVFVDPWVKALLGYESDDLPCYFEALGKVVYPEDFNRFWAAAEDCWKGGEERQFKIEHRVLLKDGTVRWSLTQGAVQRNSQGKPVRILGTATDISEQKAVEDALLASERRFQTLVGAYLDAAIVMAPDGRITHATQGTCELLGAQRPDDLVGKSALDFIAEEDCQRAAEDLQRNLREGRIRTVEYRARKCNGTCFSVELDAAVLHDVQGKPERFSSQRQETSPSTSTCRGRVSRLSRTGGATGRWSRTTCPCRVSRRRLDSLSVRRGSA
jgi:PAS domain S-box-containing protein